MASSSERSCGARPVIPRAHITGWRSQAPWPTDAQVEQDLVLTRALAEIFKRSAIAEAVAFRGGTALHKLYFERPGRYSEDIDLVQIEAGPIGNLLDAIRECLDPWLGEPRRKRGQGRITIVYRFDTTFEPIQQMRLKIEINSREHFSVLGLQRRGLIVNSPWYSDTSDITVYGLEELLGTKLRALYQIFNQNIVDTNCPCDFYPNTIKLIYSSPVSPKIFPSSAMRGGRSTSIVSYKTSKSTES